MDKLAPNADCSMLVDLEDQGASGLFRLGQRAIVLSGGLVKSVLGVPGDATLASTLLDAGAVSRVALRELGADVLQNDALLLDTLQGRGLLERARLHAARRTVWLDRMMRGLAQMEQEPTPEQSPEHFEPQLVHGPSSQCEPLLPLLLEALTRRAGLEPPLDEGRLRAIRVSWTTGPARARAQAWSGIAASEEPTRIGELTREDVRQGARLRALIRADLLQVTTPEPRDAGTRPAPLPQRPPGLDEAPGWQIDISDASALERARDQITRLTPTDMNAERSETDALLDLRHHCERLDARSSSPAERADAWIALGNTWIQEQGSIDEAVRASEHALDAQPDNPQALMAAAHWRLAAGKQQAAATCLERLASITPSQTERGAHLQTAAQLHRTGGRDVTGEQALRESIDFARPSCRPRLRLARLLQEANRSANLDETLALCHAAVEHGEAPARIALGWLTRMHLREDRVCMAYAEALAGTGGPESAAGWLLPLLLGSPAERPDLLESCSERCEEAGAPALARMLRSDTDLRASDPATAPVPGQERPIDPDQSRKCLGVHEAMQCGDGALTAERALEARRRWPQASWPAWLLLRAALMRNARLPKAELSTVRATLGEDPVVLALLAQAAEAQGFGEDLADEALHCWSELDPADPEPARLLLERQLRLRDLDGLQEHALELAGRIGPDGEEALTRALEQLGLGGRAEVAVELLLNALGQAHFHGQHLTTAAQACLEQVQDTWSRHQLAEQLLARADQEQRQRWLEVLDEGCPPGSHTLPRIRERMLRDAPLDPLRWRSVALARHEAGEWMAACSAMDRAIELAPDPHTRRRGLVDLALLRWAQGKRELGQSMLVDLLAHSTHAEVRLAPPDDELMTRALTGLALCSNSAEATVPLLHALAKQASGNSSRLIWLEAVRIAHQDGNDQKKALALAMEASSAHPEDASIQALADWLALRTGGKATLRSLHERGVSQAQSPAARGVLYARRARLLAETGDREGRIEALRAAFEHTPESPEVYQDLLALSLVMDQLQRLLELHRKIAAKPGMSTDAQARQHELAGDLALGYLDAPLQALEARIRAHELAPSVLRAGRLLGLARRLTRGELAEQVEPLLRRWCDRLGEHRSALPPGIDRAEACLTEARARLLGLDEGPRAGSLAQEAGQLLLQGRAAPERRGALLAGVAELIAHAGGQEQAEQARKLSERAVDCAPNTALARRVHRQLSSRPPPATPDRASPGPAKQARSARSRPVGDSRPAPASTGSTAASDTGAATAARQLSTTSRNQAVSPLVQRMIEGDPRAFQDMTRAQNAHHYRDGTALDAVRTAVSDGACAEGLLGWLQDAAELQGLGPLFREARAALRYMAASPARNPGVVTALELAEKAPATSGSDQQRLGLATARDLGRLRQSFATLEMAWANSGTTFRAPLNRLGIAPTDFISPKDGTAAAMALNQLGLVPWLDTTDVFWDHRGGQRVLAAASSPPAVLLGSEVDLEPHTLVFRLAATMERASPALALVSTGSSTDLGLRLAALQAAFAPSNAAAPDALPAELATMASTLWNTVPPTLQRGISGRLAELQMPSVDALRQAADIRAVRVGLLACEQLDVVLASLHHDLIVDTPPRAPRDSDLLGPYLKDHPAAGAIWRFAFSNERLGLVAHDGG